MAGGPTYFRRCLAGMASCTKSSTAHGVNHVANGSHALIRAFWLIAFAAGTGIFLYHFYTLLDRYYANPVAIVINYRVVEFTFPDITLCSVLPFSIRALEKLDMLPKLQNITDFKSQELEDLIDQSRLPIDNFILKCHFFEKPCNFTRDFKSVEDPRYRHCYTFSPTDRKALSTVPQQSLSFVLFAESEHPHEINQTAGFEIPPEWQAAGVRIAIHPPGSHPHPDIRGIDVSAGTSTVIGLSISRTVQIKDCRDRASVSVCDPHRQSTVWTYTYTEHDCYTERIQEKMHEECGCLSDEFELPENMCHINTSDPSVEKYTPVCSSNEKLRICHTQKLNEIHNDYVNLVTSKCPHMCSELTWRSRVYSADWPSQFAREQISRVFTEVHENLVANNRTSYLDEYQREKHDNNLAAITQNMVQITVHPESLSGNEDLQQVAYPLISLLGELGGILGLWLGCSVLTFFEPVELLLHAIVPCCMRHVDALQQKTVLLRTAVHERSAALRDQWRTASETKVTRNIGPTAHHNAPHESFDTRLDEGLNEPSADLSIDIDGDLASGNFQTFFNKR